MKIIFQENSYIFKIIFEKKRNKTEARLVFLKDNKELDPLEESEGGALDIAALALRLACIILSRPRVRKLLVLDEALKNLNGSVYQERCSELIEYLAKEYNLQVVLITDDDWLKIGNVIEL